MWNLVTGVDYLATGDAVRFGYDPLGRRTAVTDTLGVTRFAYYSPRSAAEWDDPLGRLERVTYPEQAAVGYRLRRRLKPHRPRLSRRTIRQLCLRPGQPSDYGDWMGREVRRATATRGSGW